MSTRIYGATSEGRVNATRVARPIECIGNYDYCAVQRIVNQLDMLQHSLYPIASTLPQKKTVERPVMARFVRKTKEGPLLRVSEK
jgi:hypothetical protein